MSESPLPRRPPPLLARWLGRKPAVWPSHVSIALARRDLIGRAKGVLLERHKITAHQAFSILVRSSQDTYRKLFEVARN